MATYVGGEGPNSQYFGGLSLGGQGQPTGIVGGKKPEPKPPLVPINDLADQYIDKFQERDPSLSNWIQSSFNDYGIFSDAGRQVNDLYGSLYDSMAPYYADFAKLNQNLDRDITGKLEDQLSLAYQQYGPEGDQSKRIENYYRDLLNTTAAQNANQQARISNAASSAGLNEGAQRSAINQAQVDSNTRYLEARRAQLADYDNVYKNLQGYISNFISQYGNSKSQYVRDTIAQLLDYRNKIKSSAADALQSFLSANLQNTLQEQQLARAGAGRGGVPYGAGYNALGQLLIETTNGEWRLATPQEIAMFEQQEENPSIGRQSPEDAKLLKELMDSNNPLNYPNR